MSKWIPVWDKLPGDCEHCCPHEWVMVWNEEEDTFAIARYVGLQENGREWLVLGLSGLSTGQSSTCPEELSGLDNMTVTHWREIPFPKGK